MEAAVAARAAAGEAEAVVLMVVKVASEATLDEGADQGTKRLSG